MENKNYAVSVILTTHNQGPDFKKAFFSLLNQSFNKPFEIIVINDASNEQDNLYIREVLKEYSSVIYKEVNNHSAILSRMDGVKLARGEYICFLDGDDFYHEDYLKFMYEACLTHHAEMANCGVFYVRKNGRVQTSLMKINRIYNSSNKAIKALFSDLTVRGFSSTKIYKAELLKTLDITPFKDLKMYEDIVFMYFVFKKINRLVNINKSLLYYNKVSTTAITNTNVRVKANIDSAKIIKEDIEKSANSELLKIFRKSYLRRLGLLYVDFSKTKFDDKKKNKEFKKQAKNELKAIYKD